VVQDRAADLERGLLEQESVPQARFRAIPAGEAIARIELRAPQSPPAAHFVCRNRQVRGIVLDQVPGERGELVPDLLDESLRAVERQRSLPAQAHAQQTVETHEVIHVGMRHEDVARPQQLARRQSRDVPQVEQQRAPLEEEVDV
jgi:hypothetical protein